MYAKLKQLTVRPNIAIDLGTANTRVYACEPGGMTEAPSVIRHIQNGTPNKDADKYTTYLNSKFVSMPLRGGVIVDIDNAITLLKPLVNRTRTGLMQPVSLACAPTDSSEQERKLLRNAILRAGASQVAIIPEVWAAAVGAGIDVTLPSAQVLIDIGEGVTDMAVIRDGVVIFASAVRTACSDLQKAVRSAIIARHKVCIFPFEAERLTHEIASLSQSQIPAPKSIVVEGVDIMRRCEARVEVENTEICNALEPVVKKILRMIDLSLKKIPERVIGEIARSGICLTGGGARINGIDRLISAKTNMNVKVAVDPTHSVINGAIQFLQFRQGKKLWWKKVDWSDFVGHTPNPAKSRLWFVN